MAHAYIHGLRTWQPVRARGSGAIRGTSLGFVGARSIQTPHVIGALDPLFAVAGTDFATGKPARERSQSSFGACNSGSAGYCFTIVAIACREGASRSMKGPNLQDGGDTATARVSAVTQLAELARPQDYADIATLCLLALESAELLSRGKLWDLPTPYAHQLLCASIVPVNVQPVLLSRQFRPVPPSLKEIFLQQPANQSDTTTAPLASLHCKATPLRALHAQARRLLELVVEEAAAEACECEERQVARSVSRRECQQNYRHGKSSGRIWETTRKGWCLPEETHCEWCRGVASGVRGAGNQPCFRKWAEQMDAGGERRVAAWRRAEERRMELSRGSSQERKIGRAQDQRSDQWRRAHESNPTIEGKCAAQWGGLCGEAGVKVPQRK
ncbi:hypothetical protein FH972_024936 [Carpinus fangiana]|uniref:Uncharacterized protein n=1 Tax=Carpinus fangiana TaxID=176857 RepID=A0A5N6KZJ9_9ROSI|nr:hypothetical protein FH972_024936 [Carpinus fangiana]